jgi:hypothetical protein
LSKFVKGARRQFDAAAGIIAADCDTFVSGRDWISRWRGSKRMRFSG